jgi:hypothetical protein
MKNIKFIFGIIALCWLPLSIFAQPGITFNRNVTLLHGLNGNGTWNGFDNFFRNQDNRRMSTRNASFTSDGGFATITADAINQSILGTDAICQSMGGVIARRIDRLATSPNGTFGGIITVGSPLDGAPIAGASFDGRVYGAIGDAAYALGRGPLASFGGATFGVQLGGNLFGSQILPGLLEALIPPPTLSEQATLVDLRVGGNGIEADKNADPTNTPKISIWGNEDSPIHWNILDDSKPSSLNFLNSIGGVPTAMDVLGYAYLAVGIVYTAIAIVNWYNFYGWYSAYTAYQWYAGYDWIMNDSERIYNNLIGSDMVEQQCFSYLSNNCHPPDTRYCEQNPGNWQRCPLTCDPVTINYCVQVHNNGVSDAFIPALSQRGEGSRSWRTGGGQAVTTIEAMHMNHKEELQPGNVEMTSIFDDVFTGRHHPVFRIDHR